MKEYYPPRNASTTMNALVLVLPFTPECSFHATWIQVKAIPRPHSSVLRLPNSIQVSISRRHSSMSANTSQSISFGTRQPLMAPPSCFVVAQPRSSAFSFPLSPSPKFSSRHTYVGGRILRHLLCLNYSLVRELRLWQHRVD